jgi:mRNA interferase MazF
MYRKFYRGDIWFVKGGKAVVGSEPYGDRPAVIVSNDKGNKSSPNVEVVYLTTKDKKYLPTHAKVLGKSPSVALCENVQTVPKDRLIDYIRTCSKTEMKRIDKALLCSFGLENTEDDMHKKLYEQLINKLARVKP